MPSSPSLSNDSLDDHLLISVADEAERSQSKFQPTASQPIAEEPVIPQSPSLSDDSLDDDVLISVADQVERSQSPTKLQQPTSQSTVDELDHPNKDKLTPIADVSPSPPSPVLPRTRPDELVRPDSKPTLTLPRISSFFPDNPVQHAVKANGLDSPVININDRIPEMIQEPRAVELPPLVNLKGKRRLTEDHLGEIEGCIKRQNINQTPATETHHSVTTSEPESAEKILHDFSRRIRNTIFRLNKSLSELSSDHQAQKFTLQAVEEHANLLVKENFHNPRADLESSASGSDTRSFVEGCTYDGDGNIISEGDQTPLEEEFPCNLDEDHCGMKSADWGWGTTYFI